mmetsp:Transcript_37279/g.148811  ORF Transcript_37279/g.148811 Transcript_37279/m.148811 type:complete len:134 (+) Transcript_37279:2308-2709(+)
MVCRSNTCFSPAVLPQRDVNQKKKSLNWRTIDTDRIRVWSLAGEDDSSLRLQLQLTRGQVPAIISIFEIQSMHRNSLDASVDLLIDWSPGCERFRSIRDSLGDGPYFFSTAQSLQSDIDCLSAAYSKCARSSC